MRRPTPETDAVAAYEGNWDTKALRMTAHARRLERQRDEEREDYRAKLREMNSRHTPETDATAEKNIYGVACKVDVDFARKLEQERDEARAELANLESLMFGGLVQSAPKNALAWRVFDSVMAIKKERDEARAVAYDLASVASHCLGWHDHESSEAAERIADTLKRWKSAQHFKK